MVSISISPPSAKQRKKILARTEKQRCQQRQTVHEIVNDDPWPNGSSSLSQPAQQSGWDEGHHDAEKAELEMQPAVKYEAVRDAEENSREHCAPTERGSREMPAARKHLVEQRLKNAAKQEFLRDSGHGQFEKERLAVRRQAHALKPEEHRQCARRES